MSGDDVMRLGKFDNNDITETLLDYCDCGGHGCEPCYAAEVIRRLRAEVERLRAVIKNAARDLYRAEVHRQGVGWDDFCTSLLVRSQHTLAAETIWQEARNE